MTDDEIVAAAEELFRILVTTVLAGNEIRDVRELLSYDCTTDEMRRILDGAIGVGVRYFEAGLRGYAERYDVDPQDYWASWIASIERGRHSA